MDRVEIFARWCKSVTDLMRYYQQKYLTTNYSCIFMIFSSLALVKICFNIFFQIVWTFFMSKIVNRLNQAQKNVKGMVLFRFQWDVMFVCVWQPLRWLVVPLYGYMLKIMGSIKHMELQAATLAGNNHSSGYFESTWFHTEYNVTKQTGDKPQWPELYTLVPNDTLNMVIEVTWQPYTSKTNLIERHWYESANIIKMRSNVIRTVNVLN